MSRDLNDTVAKYVYFLSYFTLYEWKLVIIFSLLAQDRVKNHRVTNTLKVTQAQLLVLPMRKWGRAKEQNRIVQERRSQGPTVSSPITEFCPIQVLRGRCGERRRKVGHEHLRVSWSHCSLPRAASLLSVLCAESCIRLYLKYPCHVKRSQVKPTLLDHTGIVKNDGGECCASSSQLLPLGLTCGLRHV